MAGKVKIIENGRSGKVQYVEGFWKKNVAEFYWEFGGGEVLAIVSFPSEEKWEAAYPWARGRRMDIMKDVADQVQRMKASSSRIEWGKDCFSLMQK